MSILEYLICRYGDAITADQVSDAEDTRTGDEQHQSIPDSSLGPETGFDRPSQPSDRSRSFRSVLERISGANAPIVRERWERDEENRLLDLLDKTLKRVREQQRAEQIIRRRNSKEEHKKRELELFHQLVVNQTYPDDRFRLPQSADGELKNEHRIMVEENLTTIRQMIDDADLSDQSEKPLSDEQIIQILRWDDGESASGG